jgi:hypothetical protein
VRQLAILLLLAPLTLAQPAKPKAPAPKVLMALPFGVTPGKTVKVDLRGLGLETAKDVRLVGKGTLKLLSKGKVAVPNRQDAARVGDSRVEVELTVANDAVGDTVELVVVTGAGTSAPHKVRIDRTPLIQEKEPNDGFKGAQKVKLGDTIQGRIERDRDVDVYAFEARAGQTISVEVFADRFGGALDAFLTIHDRAGNVVDSCDDIPGSRDAKVAFKVVKTGTYFATVTDANDQGGATHLYRLVFKDQMKSATKAPKDR